MKEKIYKIIISSLSIIWFILCGYGVMDAYTYLVSEAKSLTIINFSNWNLVTLFKFLSYGCGIICCCVLLLILAIALICIIRSIFMKDKKKNKNNKDDGRETV